jgi:superfamily II DNA or RNA helicase
VEALDAWAAHGRHGVVEAVTGTGKSRVGVEATREAIADGYSVVIAVPTVDLIRQWEKTLSAHGIKSVGVLGQGQRSSFDTCSVVVGTVQSLYLSPPTRPDGRVLLVADECHRYGAHILRGWVRLHDRVRTSDRGGLVGSERTAAFAVSRGL